MNKINEQEIKLIRFFHNLWKSRRLIFSAILIFFVLGCIYLFFNRPIYESKIHFTIENVPFNFKKERVIGDFQKKIFSRSVFEDWEKDQNNTNLTFDDISNTIYKNGFIFAKDDRDLFIKLKFDRRIISDGDNFHIQIKSDDFMIINEFYNYAGYVNNLLKIDYIKKTEQELANLRTYTKVPPENKARVGKEYAFIGMNISTTDIILNNSRFLRNVDNGSTILLMNFPTKPVLLSVNPYIILILICLLGGIIGTFLSRLRISILEYKKNNF